ncbi:type VI secretion system baseplate subunit TssG [Roseibium sp. Sym1]|uniref:type VI secretion system baseplate subunit TssG n=1 Tax=Roseibium sp. Sym1 TaxID=3016006 RepID=UPI0022B36C15|nr:type VI secretion system baseplate subunit TssG [Roseibium sp. Sym1]
MSGSDGKKKRKKDKQADKTIVQFAGSGKAPWPAPEAPTPADDGAATSQSAETPDVSTEAIKSHTPDSHTPDSSAPVSPATGSNEPDSPELTSSDTDLATTGSPGQVPEAPVDEPATAPPDKDVAGETGREPDEPEITVSTADVSPEPEAEDAPQEPPRIEVPVQQQYASLLAALSARIEKHPGGHDLLAVLRMLEGQTAPGGASKGMDPKKADEPAPPRIGKSRRLMEDIVRFGQDPSSEFAPSTIERATRDSQGDLVLLERFLGLLGPQGALPAAYTDEAIMSGLKGEDSFPRFLDVFNNRFVQLFFRAWADARPIVQHDRPDDDRFLAYIGSAIGIGSPIYQNLDRIDDRIKLLYAGLSASKAKSAIRLKALITGVFGVKVEIDQCVGTWLHLDPDDQLKLGGLGPGGAGQLGADTIVGAKVYSVSDKIRIRIFTRTLEEYRKFLPPTRTKPNPWTEKLFDLIDFYLGLEIEYEIELALPKRCASAVRMDSTSSATLGHIGWLKPAKPSEPEPDETLEDEEMLTDTRFRPVRRHTTVYQ